MVLGVSRRPPGRSRPYSDDVPAERSLTLRGSDSAWVGTVDELGRLVQIIEREGPTRKDFGSRPLVPSLVATERNGEVVTAATWQDLKIELDSAHIVSVTAGAGSIYTSESRVQVTLSRREGLSWSVSAPDNPWVRGVTEQLKAELRRRRPWWWWVRRQAFALAGLLSGVVCLAVLQFIDPAEPATLSSAVLIGVAIVTGQFIIGYVLARLLPGMEIVDPGSKGRGEAVMRWFGGVLVALGIGVIVNKIS